MTQQRYRSMHYDSRRPSTGLEASPTSQNHDPRDLCQPDHPVLYRRARTSGLPGYVESGPQAGDLSTLRFLQSRRLRRFDVDGPSPLLLTLNGRPVGIIRPGENTFDPPVALKPGDVLRLEAIETDEPAGAEALCGRSTPTPTHLQPGQDR